MEDSNFDNERQPEATTEAVDPTLPRIYAPRAILWFSVIFAAIFGGVLMSLNLFRTGKKFPGWLVLLASAAFTAAEIWVVNIGPTQGSSGRPLALFLNLGAGLILSKAVFPRYFPNEERYPRRKVWVALGVSILICIPLVWAAIASL